MQQTYTEQGRKTTREILAFIESLNSEQQDRLFDFIDGYMMAIQLKEKTDGINSGAKG